MIYKEKTNKSNKSNGVASSAKSLEQLSLISKGAGSIVFIAFIQNLFIEQQLTYSINSNQNLRSVATGCA